MTADIELLPLYAELQGHPKLEIVKHYTHANVAHATAPLQAEIEALRAEVDRRTERVIVHRGQALACSESAHAAFTAEKARAERLAEALRMMVENADDLVAYRHDEDDIGDRPCCQVASYEPHADHCPTHIARAALRDHDQEAGNG